ncbi:MAG TPA: hypothetical protein VFH07_11525, partial [Chitinophagaceae bacterium]|nr:hypothetical protein [Chitinophagaceae bacterium]
MICTTLVSTLSFGRALIPLKKLPLTPALIKLTVGVASLLTLITAAAFFRGNIAQWSNRSDETKNAEQQVSNVFVGQTCEGEFTITATRSYDPNTNKTTYTYQICQTGAKNALSHWGFPIELCPGETLTIQQILAGSVAQTSLNGIDWASASTSYGEDPSTNPQCTSGDVFKFDEGMGDDETCRYYRLIVDGSFTLIPISGYIKYGPRCCNFTLDNG